MKSGTQTLKSKQGEVVFRRKLAEQQSEDGRCIMPEAHTRQEIFQILDERMQQTRRDVDALCESSASISPYLEVGAERVQRALVLENDFGARGFAFDISLDMLRYASIVAEHFGYQRMPVRVACDAYNLPLRDNAVAFAFCYQTLHHFPDPRPICQELRRVLFDNGTLFFDDEPVRGSLSSLSRLYHRRGYRLTALEKVLERLGVLRLLAKADQLETEHDILEEEFNLTTWRASLTDFALVELVVNRKLNLRLGSWTVSPKWLLAQAAGGNIRAVLRKPGVSDATPHPANREPALIDLLVCPTCSSKSPLVCKADGSRFCAQCGTNYPQVDGVLLLFPPALGRSLYPDYF